jgi:serralysin
MAKSRVVAVLVGMAVAGCGGVDESNQPAPEQVKSWEQFKAEAKYEPESDVYVINQDEAMAEDMLRQVYEQYVASSEYLKTQDGLAVYYLNGADVKYSSTRAVNLTYCVSSASFGSRYSTVVNAMNSAAAAWEATARVNFIHASSYDSNCNQYQTNVFFDVRQTSDTSYLARAFFPNSGRSGRNVLISTSAFGSIYPYTLAGILRHELGHTIGFRHEHTRSTSSGCFEDYNWRALTSYDRYSVMHYPQCNGLNQGDLYLTSLDKSGARSLYP